MFKTEFEPNFEALTVALDKPSLRALSYLLRHREEWPAAFMWDFSFCDSCAMGLACDLWFRGRRMPGQLFPVDLDMGYEAFSDIFERPWNYMGYREGQPVTPEMVADRIDAYLKHHGAAP